MSSTEKPSPRKRSGSSRSRGRRKPARKRAKAKRSAKGFGLVWFLLGLLAGAVAVWVVVPPRPVPSPLPTPVPSPSPVPSPLPSPSPTPRVEGVLYLIIDDAGYSLDQVAPFLSLPFPLTVSVLPGLPLSKEVALKVQEAGKTLFLHLPMEPEGDEDPGPGALYVSMSWNEIEKVIAEDLASVPGVQGVNNHMGSRFTKDPLRMEWILSILAAGGLLFVDSRTTAESVVRETALRLGVPVMERDVFLDNEQTEAYVEQAFMHAVQIARRRGRAVAIGHVWTRVLPGVLDRMADRARNEGVILGDILEVLERR
ncbi:protein of unknown function DUF610 YibQ [Spirochaeta thermophila DSM 6578]|uniref:Divergent polysaccharide deacetylase family protein n=1 Tax=Winmispira thermophila (strain ATCC 700085 / DSM 6578 / Z-1203) TaxID=869211 RepID=G0GA01_WINT7|nr:divergent polysaccharide deacetylase family protein [Spirochaeta thermophila]AEJ61689.1 protein of unknown function DUF610 YibQ [Spirochaeta thermophila DSM 6578]